MASKDGVRKHETNAATRRGLVVGIAIGIAIGIAVCIKSDPKPDPYAKYRDVQLKRGMTIDDIKQQFGEPDRFDEYWSMDLGENLYWGESQRSPEFPHTVKRLSYGAFGAHSQDSGHVTRHRLRMTFVDGELYEWEKSTPVGRE